MSLTLHRAVGLSLALAGLGAVAALVPAQQAAAKPAFVFGGFATVQFDPALMAAHGITVEPRTKVKPTATGGVRYKIVDGKTTLKYPLKSTFITVGNLGLEQFATGRDLNFTDFRISLKPAKSVLSALSGSNIGFGGPRQTMLRIAPPKESVVFKRANLQIKNVPLTLTANGVAAMNAQFGQGAAPFTLGQVVGTLNVKTQWYNPGAKGKKS
jgi:hypothetical protein